MVEEDPRRRVDYESEHISRQEYIQALVHLYRGELFRATSWRIRLDTTTNWSILTTAGLLSFSFGGKEHSHWILLVGILLISVLLSYEARRFRFFDVWRHRVRMMEENFYGPLLRRDPMSPDEMWGERVATDLLHPSFKISFRAAIRARLTRNYWVIYCVLLGGWGLKITMDPIPAHSMADLKSNLATGIVPWYVPVTFVSAFLVLFLTTIFFFPRSEKTEQAYWREIRDKDDVPSLDA